MQNTHSAHADEHFTDHTTATTASQNNSLLSHHSQAHESYLRHSHLGSLATAATTGATTTATTRDEGRRRERVQCRQGAGWLVAWPSPGCRLCGCCLCQHPQLLPVGSENPPGCCWGCLAAVLRHETTGWGGSAVDTRCCENACC